MAKAIDFIRMVQRGESSGPVRAGRLVATGRVVKGGRTVGLVECDVLDDKERLVARASSTCMPLRGAQAAGR